MAIFAISMLLTLATVAMHHECLVAIRNCLLNTLKTQQRWIVGSTVLLLLLAHTLEIGLFALAYYVIEHHLQSGHILGTGSQGIAATLYFSFSSYTSLGMGDLYPTGTLRLVSGYEGLLGLLMIGWSASFLHMEMRTQWTDER